MSGIILGSMAEALAPPLLTYMATLFLRISIVSSVYEPHPYLNGYLSDIGSDLFFSAFIEIKALDL